MAGKKFYWIKLKDTFFKQLAIKKLRRVAGGDTHVIIYLKMMLLSMNYGGKIEYKCQTEEFVSNLSLDIDEDESNVGLTLVFLQKHELLEFKDDGAAFLPEVPSCIGGETVWAEKKRKQREKRDNVPQLSSSCPPLVRQEKEIEKDKEKDIDIDNSDFAPYVPEDETKPKKKTKQQKNGLDDVNKTVRTEHTAFSEEEYNKMIPLAGSKEDLDNAIRFLDAYKEQTSKVYASDYQAMWKWAINAYFENKSKIATVRKSADEDENARFNRMIKGTLPYGDWNDKEKAIIKKLGGYSAFKAMKTSDADRWRQNFFKEWGE